MAASIINTVEKCAASRVIRQERYGWHRIWFERGTDQVGPPARFNKLKTHLTKQSSYLYAPESTKFSVIVPPDERRKYLDHSDVTRDEMVHHWRNSGADVLWRDMVTMGLVYGGVVAKLLPDDGYGSLYYVYPGDMGVLREDVADFNKQEVIVHWSMVTMSELEKLTAHHPQQKRILQEAMTLAVPQTGGEQLPSMLQQVVATNIAGTFPNQTITGITNLTLVGDEHPISQEPIVEIAEVWEKCDYKSKSGHKFTDWLVTTVMGDWPIMERRNPILPYVHNPVQEDLPGEHPFVAIVPDPMLDYIWGKSAINSLLQLQQWRETRMNQLDRLFELSMEPPRFFSGVSLQDEKLNSLRKAGSMVSSAMPNAKMDTLKPEQPQGALDYLHEIDKMFAEQGSMTEALQGINPQGVRSGDQLGGVAGIGIGPLRSQALVVEDALEAAATKMLHLKLRLDDTEYPLPNGGSFLLAELPVGTIVKVDAHSASPVYAEQTKQDAMMLHKAGAIDNVSLIELFNPPMMESLRDKGRVLQDNKAKLMQEKLKIEAEKAKRGRVRD